MVTRLLETEPIDPFSCTPLFTIRTVAVTDADVDAPTRGLRSGT